MACAATGTGKVQPEHGRGRVWVATAAPAAATPAFLAQPLVVAFQLADALLIGR
jgi:hypothetical protein